MGRCAVRSCDYGVTAYAVTGHRLWQRHWSQPRFSATAAHNEDGRRFGASTLRIATDDSSPAKTGSPQYYPDDVFQLDLSQRDVFEQDVQIIETANGQPVLTVKVSPAVRSGENFSLSADGRRLAVLPGSALELFDHPQMSSEEQSKLAVLKTDPAVYQDVINGEFRLR